MDPHHTANEDISPPSARVLYHDTEKFLVSHPVLYKTILCAKQISHFGTQPPPTHCTTKIAATLVRFQTLPSWNFYEVVFSEFCMIHQITTIHYYRSALLGVSRRCPPYPPHGYFPPTQPEQSQARLQVGHLSRKSPIPGTFCRELACSVLPNPLLLLLPILAALFKCNITANPVRH